MSAQPDIRDRLASLKIDQAQRPESQGAAGTKTTLAVGAAAVLILGGGAVLYAVRDRVATAVGAAPAASAVRTITVAARRGPGPPPVLTATGKIVSDHRVQVATKVSGQITALHFEQGDRVEGGQVLAHIEDVIYRAQRDEARANLEKSRAAHEFQKVNFRRIERLFRAGTAPEIEFVDARRALDEAAAQAAADQAALDFAQKMLDDCEVRAPIAGVVLERNVEVGDFVAAEGGRGANANAQFGTIADMKTLRVEVDISELDIARIRAGMFCLVTPDAYKDRGYEGRVMWLDPGANYAKATVQAKVRINNPDDFLRVEGSAQVSFLDERAAGREASDRPRIWIPRSACVADPDGKSAAVFVVEGRALRRRPVSLGAVSGAQVEVLAGLSEGQNIAVDELQALRDGQPFQPPG